MNDTGSNSRSASLSSLKPRSVETIEEPRSRESLAFASLIQMLPRHRRSLVALSLTGALAALASTLPKPPLYRARTTLDLQAFGEASVNSRATDSHDKALQTNAESFVRTEIKVLESDTLLHRVVDKLRVPGATETAPPTALTPILAALHTLRKPVQRDAALKDLTHRITARPVGLTRLVEVNCDSPYPQLSANFCNTLASEFVAQDLEFRFASMRQRDEWLAKQLADIRQKLFDSEQKMQAFATENNLVVDGDNAALSRQRLTSFQDAVSRARAERTAREAAYRTSAGQAGPQTQSPDAAALHEARVKLAYLHRQYGHLSARFSPRYAGLRSIEAQIRSIEASIGREGENQTERLKNEYLASLDRERTLTAEYERLQQTASGQNGKVAELKVLRGQVESERQLYTATLQKVSASSLASGLGASPIRIVDMAVIPASSVGPRWLLSTCMGLLCGGLFGVLLAFIRESTDNHVRRPGDAARALSVREFGVIPSARAEALGELNSSPSAQRRNVNEILDGRALDLVVLHHKRSFMAEAFRSVMSAILFSRAPNARNAILVSSPTTGEGKTTLISNLGVAIAETGRRVILVDCDLRSPRLHTIFDLGNNCGVKNALRGEHNVSICPLGLLAQPTTEPNLFVLPAGSGSEDPAELLRSRNLGALLNRLEHEFEVVLIDSPPLLAMADARIIAKLSRGIVLVLRSGVATRESASSALTLLKGDETPLLGIILNDFDVDREAGHDYYRDYFNRYNEQVPA